MNIYRVLFQLSLATRHLGFNIIVYWLLMLRFFQGLAGWDHSGRGGGGWGHRCGGTELGAWAAALPHTGRWLWLGAGGLSSPRALSSSRCRTHGPGPGSETMIAGLGVSEDLGSGTPKRHSTIFR